MNRDKIRFIKKTTNFRYYTFRLTSTKLHPRMANPFVIAELLVPIRNLTDVVVQRESALVVVC